MSSSNTEDLPREASDNQQENPPNDPVVVADDNNGRTTTNLSGNVEVEELPQRTALRTLLHLNITGAVPRIIGLALNNPILLRQVNGNDNNVQAPASNSAPTAVGVTASANFEAHFTGNHSHHHHHHHAHNGNEGANANQIPQPVAPNTRQVYSVRNRLFRVIFMKVALIYAIAVPPKARKLIELLVLLSAISSLFILAYLHVAFIRTPIKCLEAHSNDWPMDGVLRVEIVTDPESLKDPKSRNEERLVSSPLNVIDYNDFNTIDKEENEELFQEILKSSEQPPVNGSDHLIAIDSLSTSSPAVSPDGYPLPLKEKVSHLEMLVRAGE